MDRDFLFGVLAVQLGQATPQQVMAAASACVIDKSKSIPERLLEGGVFTAERFAMLSSMVNEALKAHGGDVKKTMHTLGGERAVYASFGGSLVVDGKGNLSITPKPKGGGGHHLESAEDPLAVTPEASGRYRHDDGAEIGRGGIGRVLVAFDEHLGREIAVKELLGEAGGSTPGGTPGSGAISRTGAIAARFLREARVTGQLEHPNIVPVYEVGQRSDGAYYYTMKLVRGRTMAAALKQCRTLGDRLKLLHHYVDLCNAVAYAHSRGVIHRDVKTENAMLGEFGETVVLDWGLAKVKGKADVRGEEIARDLKLLHGEGTGKTVDGSAIGTPAYMSPEQADGKVDEIDERSDVWSLGAVLYELLTGRPPFEGFTPYEIIGKVLKDPVAPPRTIDPAIPAELSAVALKALTRDKSKRYQKAGDLSSEVQAYMTGGRISAYEYSSWELLKRFAARNKPVLVSAVAILAVIVAALLLVAFAWRNEAASRVREKEVYLVSEYSLARAHVQQAERLVSEQQLLAARIHALASLLHNPTHPGSPSADPEFRGGDPDADRPRMEALSVIYRTTYRHIRGLERTLRAPSAVLGAALSPDGGRVAACDQDGWLMVWNLSGDGVQFKEHLSQQSANAVAYSPDGTRIAVGGAADAILLRDAVTGLASGEIAAGSGVTALAYSPDGRRIASGHASGAVRLWDVGTGAASLALPAHSDEVRGLSFSPDGRLLATGSWDDTVRVVDLNTGEILRTIDVPGDGVYAVAFSPDGQKLATGSFDGAVRLWDAGTGALSATMEAGRDGVIAVSFSHDGRLLLSGGFDRSVRLWDVANGALLMAVEGHNDAIWAVGFTRDGRRVVSASQDGTVRVWRTNGGDGIMRLPHPDGVFALAWSPDGRCIATGGWDRTVRLWDAKSGESLRVLAGHTDGVPGVVFSADGSLVASCSYDKTVRVWDVATGEIRHVLTGHTGPVVQVAFSPDGSLLASASHDRRVRLWNPRTGDVIAVLDDHGGFVYGVSFSPDGRWLATTSFDRKVRVFDVASRKLAHVLKGHTDWVSDVAFSPDGRLLLSTSKDLTGIVWDTAAWRPLRRLVGHKQWVNRIAFSPDGRRAITAGDDGFAFLWDVATGNPLLRIDPGSAVADVAMSPDGRTIVLGFPGVAAIYPLILPDISGDVAALLREAEAAAGAALEGFALVPLEAK